ncbi:MAG: hypothetical protein JSU89_09240 [Myxococcales bacterium]|nr:MAG: hypothetical protein JSU89_09240 [Myxococcales bacterium]
MTKVVLMMLVLGAAWGASAFVATAQPNTTPGRTTPSATASEPFLLGPPKGDGPVVVQASFQLRDINDIDDEAETFEFGGVLKLTWRDERQAFDPDVFGVDEKIYQGVYQFNEISPGWFPQVVLVNESGLFEKHGVILRVQSDGTATLVETVNAAAEADLNLRRYPFDRHRLDATFEVLGADNSEVVLQAASAPAGPSDHKVQTPQWRLTNISTSTQDRGASYAGRRGIASAFVVSMEVERESFFVVRLVVIPLMLIVMLSWSVFWMERSSLGDRISVSFIGILTAVAYQIVVSEIQPDISYLTLMHGFLNLSLFIMCAAVVINLVVGALDRRGRSDAGDRVDRRCRWIFPATYFGLILVMVGVAFAFF